MCHIIYVQYIAIFQYYKFSSKLAGCTIIGIMHTKWVGGCKLQMAGREGRREGGRESRREGGCREGGMKGGYYVNKTLY